MDLAPHERAPGDPEVAERVFAGWARPVIDVAAACLDRLTAEESANLAHGADVDATDAASANAAEGTAHANANGARPLDLRRTVVVVPGRRSGRLLDRALLERAGNRPVLPPRIVTPGVLVQLVRDIAGLAPIPSATERLLVWLEALIAAAPGDRAFLLGTRGDSADTSTPGAASPGPASGEAASIDRLAAARRLDRLVNDLAAGGRRPADVPVHLDEEGLAEEAEAWAAVARIDDWRRNRLAAAGLGDAGGADVLALPTDERPPLTQAADRVDAVVLVAIPELSATQAHAIRWLASGGARIQSIIRGESSDGDRFDALGQPIPERWAARPVAPSDDALVIAERPADVTDVVVDLLAEHAADQPADDVVIGLADPSLAPLMRLSARAAGIHVHDAAGVPLAARPAVRLLQLAGRWLREPDAEVLAELARLPRFEAIAAHRANAQAGTQAGAQAGSEAPATGRDSAEDAAARDLPAEVDRWLRRTCTRLITGETPMGSAVRGAVDTLDDLVGVLRGPPRSFADWGPELGHVLARANADRNVAPVLAGGAVAEPPDDEADWLRLAAIAEDAAVTPTDFGGSVSGSAALDLWLHLAADERRPRRPVREAVDMLGWLELPTDPAAIIVLAGVHDRAIPGRSATDPLLPDRLRTELGLPDDMARLGRDAWVMSASLRGRRVARVVAGRLDAEGGAHIPSRLLLRVPDRALPGRLRSLVSADDMRSPSPSLAGGSGDAFGRPSIEQLLGPDAGTAELMDAMRVTDFSTYLRCGYRFLLQRGLQLRPPEDDPRELGPREFGTLLHDALARFAGDHESRDLADEASIRRALRRQLERAVAERIGPRPRPAVRVQIERAGRRLDAFATVQATIRAEGWSIIAAEIPLRGAAITGPDMKPMAIRGTIDRIDRHANGAWRIIDYKAGDAPKDPRAQHLIGGRRAKTLEWRDLQLPLYRRLARGRLFPGHEDDAKHWFAAHPANIDGPVDVGYIVLPASAEDTGWRAADFTDDEVDDAMDRARQIVAAIRAGVFDPAPAAAITSDFDDWAWMCHAAVDVFGGPGNPDDLAEDPAFAGADA
ncbi:MAG: PD-(D/E)XK nuclease family protein [Phycisphaerales bacterium]